MHLVPMLLASLLAVPLAAQNWVTNGDFSNGLTGWTETGYAGVTAVENFDVTGLGATTCYAASHGGQTTPSPYPPNSIKQNVLVLAGVPLEFSMDICVYRPATGGNADAGTFWVTIGGTTEIARVAFGNYVSQEYARARLTTQFVHPTGGNLDLEIFMHRSYLSTSGTPRARITNIELEIATGPTFTFDAQRRLGRTSTIGGVGAAGAPFAFYLALQRLPAPGAQVPGIGGTLYLDPTFVAPFFSGVFDPVGVYTQSLTVPANPALASGVFYVQGLQLAGGALALGFDQFLQFQ